MSKEQEMLNEIRKLIPNSQKYLHDDAAIIENNLIVTTDTIVENIHFTLKTYKPEEIGWKAMAVNLSDIAAMGGEPLYSLIALSLPKNIKINWVKSLYKGLVKCAKKYKTQIIGGNLARGKEINITVTLIGKSISKNIPKRSNAKPGDIVFTTGTFGDSGCGFLALNSVETCHGMPLHTMNKLITIHKQPIPKINLGQKFTNLTKRVTLMDASDGLADCLIQISNESKVNIIVNESTIPVSNNTRLVSKFLNKNPLELALYSGEDYQLVGTVSKNDYKRLEKIKSINIIGEVKKGKNAYLKQKNGQLVKLEIKKAFKHFT